MFWDGLSTIPLTKSALKKLDRRNAKPVSSSSCGLEKPRRRPTTRDALAKWKGEHPLWEPVSQLSDKEKRFARQGGLDLTNLRGV